MQAGNTVDNNSRLAGYKLVHIHHNDGAHNDAHDGDVGDDLCQLRQSLIRPRSIQVNIFQVFGLTEFYLFLSSFNTSKLSIVMGLFYKARAEQKLNKITPYTNHQI